MKKFIIIITLFLIVLSKRCGPWAKLDPKTLKCECRYAQNIKTRKCVPPSNFCRYGIFEDGRCKPKKRKENKPSTRIVEKNVTVRSCPPTKKYVKGKCVSK